MRKRKLMFPIDQPDLLRLKIFLQISVYILIEVRGGLIKIYYAKLFQITIHFGPTAKIFKTQKA